MHEQLKSCPFCGGAASEYPNENAYGDTWYEVGCYNRECFGPEIHTDTIEKSRKKWNARADLNNSVMVKLNNFMRQIVISDFQDSRGHKIEMNIHYIKLKEALALLAGDEK